jgi:hypothetical protein
MESKDVRSTPQCHHLQPLPDNFASLRTQPKTCHFLHKLPLEVRRQIYSYLLSDSKATYTPLRVREKYIISRRHQAVAGAHFTSPPHKLAQISRQIRSEALQLHLGDAVLKAEVIDKLSLDVVIFERCLASMRNDVRHIKRLDIRHKVDFYLRAYRHTATAFATTRFTVSDDGQTVDVACDWMKQNGYEDELPRSIICWCPIADRMGDVNEGVVSAAVEDCPLTRTVYTFLQLLRHESTTPCYFQYGYESQRYNKSRSHLWPLCESCGARKWFLQGPRLSLDDAIAKGWKDDEVVYKGLVWKALGSGPIAVMKDETVNSHAYIFLDGRWRARRELRLVVPENHII